MAIRIPPCLTYVSDSRRYSILFNEDWHVLLLVLCDWSLVPSRRYFRVFPEKWSVIWLIESRESLFLSLSISWSLICVALSCRRCIKLLDRQYLAKWPDLPMRYTRQENLWLCFSHQLSNLRERMILSSASRFSLKIPNIRRSSSSNLINEKNFYSASSSWSRNILSCRLSQFYVLSLQKKNKHTVLCYLLR